MTVETIGIAVLSAVLVLVGKIVFDWMAHSRRSSNGNGSAGEQPKAYYDARFDRLEDMMQDALDRQKKIHDAVVHISAICSFRRGQ